MKFVDDTRITVQAGSGGRGCLSFRREAFVPKGGPDGGDGGKGGDVYIEADEALGTLLDCQYQQLYRAGRGAHGSGNNRQGKSADDLVIPVPVGTLVYDEESGQILADLSTPGERARVAKGGRGGRGNARFVTSRNRAPRRFEEGEPGEERRLRLELKLVADVGLVGMPNSGKSTLLAAVSRAKPRIADYPFTTTTPNLGVVRTPGGGGFVMADIPGLIEDAHRGAGMGDRFLRHIERTRVLLHLVDPAPLDELAPPERFRAIMRELRSYGRDLADRPMIVVITKMDLPENQESADELRAQIQGAGHSVHMISAVTGAGVKELLINTADMLKAEKRQAEAAGTPVEQ